MEWFWKLFQLRFKLIIEVVRATIAKDLGADFSSAQCCQTLQHTTINVNRSRSRKAHNGINHRAEQRKNCNTCGGETGSHKQYRQPWPNDFRPTQPDPFSSFYVLVFPFFLSTNCMLHFPFFSCK